MDPITWPQVVALDATLATVPDAVQVDLLAYANSALNPKMFTASAYKLARLYLAAHFGTLSIPGEAGGAPVAGPVVSESVGGISRTYALVSDASNSTFSTTTHGQMYAFLVRTSKARLPFALGQKR